MIKVFTIAFFCMVMIFQLLGQTPTADFSLSIEVCSNEQFHLENISTDAVSYEWDFCTGDFELQPNAELFASSTNYNTNNNISIYSDSKSDSIRYVFLPSGGAKKIYRFKTDDTLNEILLTEELNLSGVTLGRPIDISILKVDTNYFGYLVDFNTNKLHEINFGSDIENQPISVADLGGFSSLNQPIAVKAVEEGDNVKIAIANYNSTNLTIVTKDSDGVFSHENFNTGSSRGSDIDLLTVNSSTYGVVAFPTIGRTRLYDFGSIINSTPTLLVDYANAATPSPNNAKWIIEGGKAKILVQSNNANIGLMEISANFSAVSQFINYGNFGLADNSVRGLSVHQNIKSEWHALVPNILTNINKINFENACEVSPGISNDENPTISYFSSGTYPITLTAFDSNGNSSSITKEITVTNNQAPQVDFQTGANLCVTAPISFTGISNEAINSWNWDFGDGNSATGQNPAHTYTAAGAYEVLLLIEGANGCNNRIQKTVTVYEPQPVTFTSSAQGAICSQKPILFENTTDLPDIATYEWSFGDGNTSTLENPEHVYQNSGEYIVGLTVSFAGCQSYAEQTITVNPGPSVSFTTIDNCLGQVVSFQNTSQGEFITSYLWDFGDGTTSTQENPEYAFESAGTQMIELTAFTSNGCDFTIQQRIEVYPVAVVDFSTEVACATQPLQFNEEVFLEISNVSSYLWDFGIAGTTTDISTEANPQFTFPEAGIFLVSLQVTTVDGCVSEGQKVVTVQNIPQTSFSYEPQCVGSTITFQGNVDENINTNFWELKNSAGEVLAVGTQANFTHSFANPGTFTLRYRQQNSQFCSNEYEETIEILSNPVPNFTFSQTCAGLPVNFFNDTDVLGNTIDSYNWSIDGETISNNTNPEYTFAEPGNYEVSLQVNTVTGCTETILKTVEVKPLPDVSFDLEQTVGAYPFQLKATVEEQVDFAYEWTINGMLVSEESVLMDTIQEAGNYLITLSATNSEGCTNSASQQVRVRVPEMDISLSNLRVVPQGGDATGFVVSITNEGSLIPDLIDLEVDFGNFSVTERVDRVINPESTVNYSMRLNLTESQLRGLNKICLNAKVVGGAFEEQITTNNRTCTNLDDVFRVLDIYPNPARANVTVPIIVPNDGDLMVVIEQSDGKQTDQILFELEIGYNEIQLNRGSLKSGIYFFRFRFEGAEKVKKVVFQ